MTEKLDLYKCHICGNIVQVLISGVGELICCEQPMTHLTPRTEENHELAEKHTPTIEQEECQKFVRLKHHPMNEDHYIQFIEIYSKNKNNLHLKFLHPNEVAEFEITNFEDDIDAIEYCNIHGLWRNNDD